LPSSPSQHDSSLPSVSPLSEKTTFIGFPQEILNPPYKTLWQLSNDNTLNQEDYVVNLQLLMDKTAVEPDDLGSPVSKRRRVDSLSPLTDLSSVCPTSTSTYVPKPTAGMVRKKQISLSAARDQKRRFEVYE
jgi:hypothetical protein